MKVSFEKLFALMQERGMERKDLIAITGLSAATVWKMAHNKVVTSQVIGRVCEAMKVPVEEVMEVTWEPEIEKVITVEPED